VRAGRGKTDPDDTADETVSTLADLFLDHPGWQQAAREIARVSMSNVYFTHLPGLAWHLEQREVGSALEPGKVDDPDFVFRFAPGAVRRLRRVKGGIGEFAAELFSLADGADPEHHVDLRVVASFSRLRERGYLRLLVRAGPRVAAYGLSRGIFSVADVGKLVRQARDTSPYEWEI